MVSSGGDEAVATLTAISGGPRDNWQTSPTDRFVVDMSIVRAMDRGTYFIIPDEHPPWSIYTAAFDWRKQPVYSEAKNRTDWRYAIYRGVGEVSCREGVREGGECNSFLSADNIGETLEYTSSNGSPSARLSMPLFTSCSNPPSLQHLGFTALNML